MCRVWNSQYRVSPQNQPGLPNAALGALEIIDRDWTLLTTEP